MSLEKVSVGPNPPVEVNVIIENPKGADPVKYELDKESGLLVVDRFLHTPMRYPGNYGFIPHTLSGDGDPVDVVVVSTLPVVPGALLPARPIGVLLMEDDKGQDEKIIAVPTDAVLPYHENVEDINDLPQIVRDQIAHFFTHYKDLEKGKWSKLLGWGDVNQARQMIIDGIARAKAGK